MSLSIPARFAVGAIAVFIAAPALAQSPTRTRLLSSPNPSNLGQPVTLTAEVDGLGGGAPTGLVAFTDGAVRLGSAPLRAVGAGQATVAAGNLHTCALTSAGGVKCWGGNGDGQLGDGARVDRRTPVAVVGLSSGVVALAAGNWHTCAATSAGGVKCWGRNVGGQLGDGTRVSRLTPTAVVGLPGGVVALAAGVFHTCALTSAGGVKCWGGNGDGQLGDGTTISRLTPAAIVGLSSGVVALAAGDSYTCALTSAGGAKCWGWNVAGQLGDGTRISRLTPVAVVGLSSGVVALAAGKFHTCALTSAGGAKCWGSNGFGQLGDGTRSNRLTPVAVVGLSSGLVTLAAEQNHTCALTSAGGAKCWGWNGTGQLGDGTTISRLTPVAVVGLSSGIVALAAGGHHTCALTSAGGAKCWGWNYLGQLGDGTAINRLTPVTTRNFAGLVRAWARLSTSVLGRGAHLLRASYLGSALHRASVGVATHTVR